MSDSKLSTAAFPPEALAKFAKAREAYVSWLASMPADFFAPASHEEILTLYDKNCNPAGGQVAAQVPAERGSAKMLTVSDLIARSEAIPSRKAALDRARVRRALASIQHAAMRAMPHAQVVAELCKTPAGQAQYDLICQRQPGSPYPAMRLDSGLSVEEVVLELFDTPEARAEFDLASGEMRQELGLADAGPDHLTSLAKAALFLLQHARTSLVGGLESECELEAEWSKEDRALVARMDIVLENFLAKSLLTDM